MKPRYWLDADQFARVVRESVDRYRPGVGFRPIFVDVCYRLRAQGVIAPFQMSPSPRMVMMVLCELIESGSVVRYRTDYIDGRGIRTQVKWFRTA